MPAAAEFGSGPSGIRSCCCFMVARAATPHRRACSRGGSRHPAMPHFRSSTFGTEGDSWVSQRTPMPLLSSCSIGHARGPGARPKPTSAGLASWARAGTRSSHSWPSPTERGRKRSWPSSQVMWCGRGWPHAPAGRIAQFMVGGWDASAGSPLRSPLRTICFLEQGPLEERRSAASA